MSELITVNVPAVALNVTGVALRTAAAAIVDAMAGADLSEQGRRMLEARIRSVPETVETIGSSPQPPARENQITALPPQEGRLVAELTSAAHLAAGDPATLAATLRARPVDEWPKIIGHRHAQIFRQSVAEAVARACRGLDFTVEVEQPARVLARDLGGRALAVDVSAEGMLRAEVLGVADGTCRQLVDRFLDALETEGVTLGEIAGRRWTGGAPGTQAGRTWVARRAPRPGAIRTPAERRPKGGAGRVQIKGRR